MGNEKRLRTNFAAISAWLHDFDPTRPVHYEGAQGVDGNPDPKTVDVISRFYTRVKQEYLIPVLQKERIKNALKMHAGNGCWRLRNAPMTTVR